MEKTRFMYSKHLLAAFLPYRNSGQLTVLILQCSTLQLPTFGKRGLEKSLDSHSKIKKGGWEREQKMPERNKGFSQTCILSAPNSLLIGTTGTAVGKIKGDSKSFQSYGK